MNKLTKVVLAVSVVLSSAGVALANCTATSNSMSQTGRAAFVSCAGPTGASGQGTGQGNGSTFGTVTADLVVGTRTTANGLNINGSTLLTCRGIDEIRGLGNRSAGASDTAGCEKMDKVFISVRQ
jgi:hypothetical protein